MTFFRRRRSQTTRKRQENGLRLPVVSITLLVLAVLWLDVVLICLLLMTLTPNRI